ncbi:doubled CXXCH motif protein [Geobacter sp. OR-1]|nr:doubled CXXCH motif protein [Geobacter sp. OR-1]
MPSFSSSHGGGSVKYNPSTKLCTNIYCHSNGNPAAIVYQNPVAWNVSATYGCSSCHGTSGSFAGAPDYPNGGPVPSPTANSHPGHVGVTSDTTICSACHAKTVSRSVSGVLKDYTAVRYHLNGSPNVYLDPLKAGAAASFNPGNAQCSNVICHGGNNTLSWGADSGKPKCQKCHGYRTPGWNALNGATANSDAKVGAHFNHISSTSYKYSRSMSCAECHAASIALPTDNVNATGHYDTAPPAEISFNALAKTDGLNPSYMSGICSNTYCHGASLPASNPSRANPAWSSLLLTGSATLGDGVAGGNNPGSGDCAQCHGYPPQNDHTATNCNGCHKHLNPDNMTFNDPSLHINGVVDGGSCLGCHASVKAATGTSAPNMRAAIAGQFNAQSHHIQKGDGSAVTNADCYFCHMEADASGNTTSYHQKTTKAAVDLVIWSGGARSANFIRYTANGSRNQVNKINSHCLGCHSTTSPPADPFGDGKSPSRYAWDSRSIEEKYSNSTTTTWSQYSTANTNRKKHLKKAYSAHGNAANNQMGWSSTTGYEVDVANFTGNVNVNCYDCHNSHGSAAAGVTSSYSSATGKYKGAILKHISSAGTGGYTNKYKPTAHTASTGEYNSYNAGAAVCFDCHNTRLQNSALALGGYSPWGYNDIFGSSQALNGYWDTPYFGAYSTNSVKRYPYKGMVSTRYGKSMAKPAGGHFGVSATMGTTVSGSINGLCTPCHDPHGVSQNTTKVANPVYGVPLLKGTWLTSPYAEDVAPANTNRSRGGGSRENTLPGVGGGSDPLYNIDQNTFQADRTHLPATVPSRTFGLFGTSAVTLQTQTSATSGGLCLTCHNQSAIAPNAGGTAPTWKTTSRIHNTVTGWGSTSTGNAGNVVHSYTCSKCHAPHVSQLPRLMVTNCLDVKHRGRVASGGTVAATAGNNPTTNNGNMMAATAITTGKGAGRFPAGGARWTGTPSTSKYPGPWAFGATTTTGTTPDAAYTTNCHNSATAGGSAWVPSNQIWNTRTNW